MFGLDGNSFCLAGMKICIGHSWVGSLMSMMDPAMRRLWAVCIILIFGV
jgi:hypothetical protein